MSTTQLLYKNYLAVIRNSIGTKIYKNFFVLEDGVEIDVMKDGSISCAFYLSNILHMFPNLNLIKSPHATVKSTINDMLSSGWEETELKDDIRLEVLENKIGAVIRWETGFGDDGAHEHIGFYMGNEIAISHSDKVKTPTEHHFTFNGTRKITNIYWHRNLKN